VNRVRCVFAPSVLTTTAVHDPDNSLNSHVHFLEMLFLLPVRRRVLAHEVKLFIARYDPSWEHVQRVRSENFLLHLRIRLRVQLLILQIEEFLLGLLNTTRIVFCLRAQRSGGQNRRANENTGPPSIPFRQNLRLSFHPIDSLELR
jgi:hypothetical protein